MTVSENSVAAAAAIYGRLLERFCRYVRVNTQADEAAKTNKELRESTETGAKVQKQEERTGKQH